MSGEGLERVTPTPEQGGQWCLGLRVVGVPQPQRTFGGTWRSRLILACEEHITTSVS